MVLSGLTSLFADEENDNEEQRVEFASDAQGHSDELLRQLLNGDFDDEGKEHLTNKNDGEHSRTLMISHLLRATQQIRMTLT